MYSILLQRYPPREMATGVFIMTEYKAELITKVLDLLTPQNLRYTWMSRLQDCSIAIVNNTHIIHHIRTCAHALVQNVCGAQ